MHFPDLSLCRHIDIGIHRFQDDFPEFLCHDNSVNGGPVSQLQLDEPTFGVDQTEAGQPKTSAAGRGQDAALSYFKLYPVFVLEFAICCFLGFARGAFDVLPVSKPFHRVHQLQ